MTTPPDIGRRTLRWLAGLCGTDRLAVLPMAGGAMGRLWSVTVEGEGQPSIALKEFTREQHGEYAEKAVRREALALGLRLPRAPALVGADPVGGECDEPVVAMAWLPGETRLAPGDALDAWLRPMAALLAEVHSTDVSGSGLREIPGTPERFQVPDHAAEPPDWAIEVEGWRRAINWVDGRPLPATERVLVHNDFHPGNLLWIKDDIVGLLDWTFAAVAAPEHDLAHCRINLALLSGLPAADRFLELYRELKPGPDCQRWFDLVEALTFLPYVSYWRDFGRADLSQEELQRRFEEFVVGRPRRTQSSSSGTGS